MRYNHDMQQAENEEIKQESKTKKISKVAKAFLGVGFLGFGGGSANIPVIEKEALDKQNLTDGERFTQQIVVANITPGAFPVKIGNAMGGEYAGILGGLVGSVLATLPGALLSLIIVSLLSLVSPSFLQQVGYFSVGISSYIIYLMFKYINKVWKESKKEHYAVLAYILTFAVFLASCSSKVRELLTVLSGNEIAALEYEFKLSMINIIILCFWVILFTEGKWDNIKSPICIVVALFYIIASGVKNLMPRWVQYIALGLMAIGVTINLIMFAKRYKKENADKEKTKINFKPALITFSICLGAILVMMSIAMLSSMSHASEALSFTLRGMLSVVSTFGGGAAYYPVAEDMFVSSGIISSEIYYSQLMPVVNAMPGPVLVKLVSTIGFQLGNQYSMFAGYMYGFLGMTIGIGVSVGVFTLVYSGYKAVSELPMFKEIKKWILPCICGLLMTTTLSLLVSIFRNGIVATAPHYATGIFAAVLVGVMMIVNKKIKVNDFIIVIISGLLSLGFMNIFLAI